MSISIPSLKVSDPRSAASLICPCWRLYTELRHLSHPSPIALSAEEPSPDAPRARDDSLQSAPSPLELAPSPLEHAPSPYATSITNTPLLTTDNTPVTTDADPLTTDTVTATADAAPLTNYVCQHGNYICTHGNYICTHGKVWHCPPPLPFGSLETQEQLLRRLWLKGQAAQAEAKEKVEKVAAEAEGGKWQPRGERRRERSRRTRKSCRRRSTPPWRHVRRPSRRPRAAGMSPGVIFEIIKQSMAAMEELAEINGADALTAIGGHVDSHRDGACRGRVPRSAMQPRQSSRLTHRRPSSPTHRRPSSPTRRRPSIWMRRSRS
ncbi:hypothetical protein BD626DRAFT_521913, partial [Schizophyllum amplum]